MLRAKHQRREIAKSTRGMNVMVFKLSGGKLRPIPDKSEAKVGVEDNIGEGIHIHWHQIRFEMLIKDFMLFAEKMEKIEKEFFNGYR